MIKKSGKGNTFFFAVNDRSDIYGNVCGMQILNFWRHGLVTVFILFFLNACSSGSGRSVFEHNYPNFKERYTQQELKNILYRDTLDIGPDSDGKHTASLFYIRSTQQLLADLTDDRIPDSLYPMQPFDEISARRLPLGFSKSLSEKQMNRLLEIINNPVSFDWDETTYEAEIAVNFMNNGSVVKSLTIGADLSVVKPEDEWPVFRKMKFGSLKSKPRKKLKQLITEIGL